jgi:Uncharacterized conserved protein (DUF2183)
MEILSFQNGMMRFEFISQDQLTIISYDVWRIYIDTILPTKVILIGDTLVKDPEVYGEIYRKYPDWVLTILIRMTGDECLYRNSTVE